MRIAFTLIGLAAPALALANSAGVSAAGAAAEPVTARAVIRAGDTVDVAAALSQRLTYAPYKPGRFVAKGKPIARFDCARLEAELAAREQAIETLSLRYESEVELEQFGATGALDVAVAKSERDQAKAEAKALRVTLEDCEITAPFAAYVAERHLSAHETPQVGQPIYTLLRAGDVEISVIVPAALGATLKPGSPLTLAMDGSDTRVPAKIVRLAPDIDPVSQTREVFAEPTAKAALKPGMSATALFDPPALPGPMALPNR